MNKLEDWCLIDINSPLDYLPPEAADIYFVGKVYGHSFHEDGTRIVTAQITSFSNGKFYTFSGTEYELGVPSKQYEDEYPNAKKRIENALA